MNLQYGDCEQDLDDIRAGYGINIRDWPDSDPLQDLDDYFAKIAALDLVISVDNSTVHFAGSAGVPVWTLLNWSPEFRWMLDRSDTPWYRSMELFRQSSPGDWPGVMQKVSERLSRLPD